MRRRKALVAPGFSLARDLRVCQYGYRISNVDTGPMSTPKEGVVFREIRDSPCEQKPIAISLGPHVEGCAQPHADLSDTDTMIAGVLKRIAMKHPEPNESLRKKFKIFVGEFCKKNLTPLPADTDTSFETWIEKCPYPRWRKDQLKQKYENITNRNDTKHQRVKCFLKDERYPSYKKPRGIYSTTDEYKCMIGPFFRVIEEKIYELPQFIKHIPVRDRPQYIFDYLKGEGAVYATDYTAYESQFTQTMMDDCEMILYNYMTKYLPEHKEFVRGLNVLRNDRFCQFKFFDAKIPCARMSGEMNTSLGNGFSNLMFASFIAAERGDPDLKIVIEGDDGLMRTTAKLGANDFAELGLTIKIECHDSMETASFCGIIFDSEDKLTLTNPLEVLVDFGWGPSRYANAKKRKLDVLLRSKSLSLAHQYPGCPIISELAQYGLRVTRHVRRDEMKKHVYQSPMNQWEREQLIEAYKDEHNIVVRPPGSRSRTLISKLYGIEVSVQLKIENYLKNKTDSTPIILPYLQGLCPVEWSNYFDLFTRTVHPDDQNTQYFPRDGVDHRKMMLSST